MWNPAPQPFPPNWCWTTMLHGGKFDSANQARGQGDTSFQCPPVPSRISRPYLLRPCFYSNQRIPYRSQVMVAVPHRMVLQEELAGQWSIGVERNRGRAIEILVL